MTYYSGRVNTVVYESDAAFYILKMVLDDTDTKPENVFLSGDDLAFAMADDPTVTVKGHVPGMPIHIGTWFGFEARWQTHSKYGKQLQITRAPVIKGTWNPESAAKILVANGVSERMCAQIRSHYGEGGFLDALGSEDSLQDVPGITQFAARYVVQRWESIQAHFKALDFLSDLGLPTGKVTQVWATFQDDAVTVLSKNPWALVRVDGITFEQADEVAKKLGLDLTSPLRVQGALLWAVKNGRGFGHVYHRTGALVGAVRRMVGDVSKADVAKAIAACHKEGTLILDRETKPGTMAVYEPWMYHLESEGARRLKERLETARVEDDPDDYLKALESVGPETQDAVEADFALRGVIETAINEWGLHAHLSLSEKQRDGVLNALLHPVSILTGLPGTGKTTSLRAAVRILQDAGVPFLLCAPTGIAAKNLGAVTGARASTIHRAFSAKGSSDDKRDSTYTGIVGEGSKSTSAEKGEGLWGYGSDNPYPADVVIVDEASMVDAHLLYRLLDCTSPTCRLVFVGDHAQLPSVGPGNVLRNLIESGRFPTVKLTEIFRQKEQSDIVHAAHAIHAGDMPLIEPPSDFVLYPKGDEGDVLEVICRLAEKLYDKRANFQILSPRHAGTVGVTNLNSALRSLLNPPGDGIKEVKLGNDVIREDDRVMVVKNNYEKGVFNGDVGKVQRVDRKAKAVEIKIFGDPAIVVDFAFKDMGRYIRLAYACTVHKAQGLEYDVIVMPIVTGFRHQLQRNLLYTAVTRAKKRVVLVGTQQALARAISNDKEDLRDTLLVERLR